MGRITREIRADGTATAYTYETTTSRVKTITDPKAQVTTYTYNVDDPVAQIVYTNVEHSTPSVSFTYDANYHRLTSMTDGTGTTTYSYEAVGGLGGTQIASVDGPLGNDTITFYYDELGRVSGRNINGVAASQEYDALGRVTSHTSVLGAFATSYVGMTGEPASITYPNGQTTTYAYELNAGDRHLKEIHNTLSGGATLSKFTYTTDVVRRMSTWRQQAGANAANLY